MKKEIERKIKEKCRELDLIELEKKKKKRSNYKYWIMSLVLIVVIILVILLNSSDPTKVYDKKIEYINQPLSNSTSILNQLNISSGTPLLIISIATLIISIMFVRKLFNGVGYV